MSLYLQTCLDRDLIVRVESVILLLVLCFFAGCATLGGTPRIYNSTGSQCIVPTSARQTSLVRKHDSDKVPAFAFRLAPIVMENSAPFDHPVASEPELVSIDAFANTGLARDSQQSIYSLPKGSMETELSRVAERDTVWGRVLGDQSNFYSKESLLQLGMIFGAGAVIANSNADDQLQKHFQSSVRGASSDDWFQFLHSSKELGNGYYTLPIFGTAWLASEFIDGPPAFDQLGQWGERSVRGFLVGATPLMLMQHVTGGSRPYETLEGSEWHPFRDNNGVSGHAFMSSLPFITAAKLTENSLQKAFWYSASAIGPLSRMNDNAHYPSQIAMGWAIAFVSATAVQQTETGRRGWTLKPLSSLNSTGVALEYQW